MTSNLKRDVISRERTGPGERVTEKTYTPGLACGTSFLLAPTHHPNPARSK